MSLSNSYLKNYLYIFTLSSLTLESQAICVNVTFMGIFDDVKIVTCKLSNLHINYVLLTGSNDEKVMFKHP